MPPLWPRCEDPRKVYSQECVEGEFSEVREENATSKRTECSCGGIMLGRDRVGVLHSTLTQAKEVGGWLALWFSWPLLQRWCSGWPSAAPAVVRAELAPRPGPGPKARS